MHAMQLFKKSSLALFSMCLISLSLFSCSSSSSNSTGPQEAAEGTVTAKVENTTITTLTQASFASKVQTTLHIQGNTGGGTTSAKAFAFIIMNINGQGTYPIGGGANISNSASYIETQIDFSNPTNSKTYTWQAPYDDTKVGEVYISYIDNAVVKGTFYFKGKNVNGDNSIKNITSGSFNVKFTK